MSGSDNKRPTVNCSDGGNHVHGIQFPLGRSRNGLRQRRIKGLSNPNSNPAAPICGGRGGWGVYCCFRHPQTSGSPEESPTNDPNNPKFSYGSLKALIEKNDFYSRDCNPYFNSSPDCTDDNVMAAKMLESEAFWGQGRKKVEWDRNFSVAFWRQGLKIVECDRTQFCNGISSFLRQGVGLEFSVDFWRQGFKIVE